jgi:hypothetical protein
MGAAGGAVGPVDLDHDLAVGVQEAGQAGTVGAGAFHAPCLDLAESAGPGEQGLVAVRGGRDAGGGHAPAELIACVGDVDVEVGSTPTVTGERSCAIVVIAVSFRDWWWMARAPAGRTAL